MVINRSAKYALHNHPSYYRVTILKSFAQKSILSFKRLTLRQILVTMLEQFVNL